MRIGHQASRNISRLVHWAVLLLLPSSTFAAEVSSNTLAAWEESVHSVRERLVHDGGAVLTLGSAQQFKRITQKGEKPTSEPVVHGEVEAVPSGLIHHWIGTISIPNARVPDVVSILQDYESYSKVYAPAVVESRLGTHTADEFNYRLKFVQKGFGVQVGLSAEFRTTYHASEFKRGYSVTEATKLTEVQSPGGPDEKIIEGSKSFGYVKKSFTVVRYQQSAEGTIVQVESLTLSRGVNGSVRWIVMPVIRRFSQQTIVATLERLRENVLATRDGAFASTR